MRGLNRSVEERREGRVLMARGERIAASPFAQFMVSTAGRVTRGVIGLVLIALGFVVAGIAGWILGALGLVLVLAGLLDFCVVTGLVDNIWSGREVRARGSLATKAPRA
jgi:hypothetical protein